MRERKHRTVRMNVLLDSPTVVVLREWRCTLGQCAMVDLIEGVNDFLVSKLAKGVIIFFVFYSLPSYYFIYSFAPQ